jgi:hypothetical protein
MRYRRISADWRLRDPAQSDIQNAKDDLGVEMTCETARKFYGLIN